MREKVYRTAVVKEEGEILHFVEHRAPSTGWLPVLVDYHSVEDDARLPEKAIQNPRMPVCRKAEHQKQCQPKSQWETFIVIFQFNKLPDLP